MRALLLLLSLAQDPPLPAGAEARLKVGDGKTHVTALAISPDGRLLASGDREGIVRIWKLPSRDFLLKETGGTSGIGSLVFSPDGKTVYWTVWHEGTFRFDLETRESKKIADGTFWGTSALTLSPDGKLLATTDMDRNLYLFRSNGDKGGRAAIPGMPQANPDKGAYRSSKGRDDPHRLTAFSPDGQSVCWGWDGGTIRIYDVQTRKPQVVLPGHNEGKLAHSVAYSPEGKLLGSRGYDSTVKIWDIAGQKTVFERSARGGEGLAFSPDGSLLAWGEGDGAVRFVDVAGKKAIGELKGSTAEVRAVLFSADRTLLISGVDDDGTVLLWKMEEVRRRASADPPEEQKPVTEGTLLGTIDESGAHHGLVFSPDARRAAWVLRDPGGEILIVDGQPVTDKSRSITGGVFSPDGRRLACIAETGPQEKKVLVDGRPENAFHSIGTPLFSADGKRIAYSAEDAEGRAHAVVDGKPGPPFNVVSWISFSDDGLHVAYIGYDPGRRLDVAVLDGKETGISAGRIQYLAFRPDGRSLVYATYGASSRMEWDGKKGEDFDWTGLPTFSRDGKTLAYFGVRKSTGFVVVNSQATEIPIGVARSLHLSSDGNRWACAGDQQVVVDGKPGTSYEAVGPAVFSPDGKKIAHAAKQAGRWRLVVVGGRVSEEYDEISTPQFTENGRQVSFGAREGRKIWRRVLPLD